MKLTTSAYLSLCIISWMFFALSCSQPESNDDQGEFPEVTESEIRSADGRVLLHIDDVPGSILVDEETGFGAATHFTGASFSPDGDWFAITTEGVANGGGWLFNTESGEMMPAAFQYGGSVLAGPWRGDSRFVVFILEGPAPTRTLSVTDLENVATTVTENTIPVRLPDHSETVPPETVYEPMGWDGTDLIFSVDEDVYRYDVTSGEVFSEKTNGSLNSDP